MDDLRETTEKSILRKRAWGFGFVGILSYTIGYVVRYLLSVSQPAMLETGADVPMFGLAKKREEIFLPGQKTR